MSDRKLVVIDGSSLIYRAFFALPPLTTADGTPTNAVYGFTTMLLKLLEEERPDVILIAFEGGKTFRHTEFADYKAQRPRTPDDLAVQGPIARVVAEGFRIPLLQHKGYEADDVIGTLTCLGAAAGFQVLVVTGDLDALQLVNDRVKVMVNRRGITDTQVYDTAAVEERFGLPPALLPDFKALKGDTSDNIPGIAGVGDKTATTLLQKYGSLEALLEHTAEITAAKVRTNLTEGKQNALLYKRLATVVTDLPLETPWEAWAYPGPDVDELRELFRLLEFRTLGRRVEAFAPRPTGPAEVVPVADQAETPWRKLGNEDEEELTAWAERAREAGTVAVRSLQVGGSGRTGTVTALALSAAGETVVLGSAEGETQGLFAEEGAWTPPDPIRALLSNPQLRVVGHDLKRELHPLCRWDLSPEPGFDTQVAAYVLNPGRSNYRLEDLSREYLGREVAATDPLEQLANEASAIADLQQPMRERLKSEDLTLVFEKLELPLIPILARMEVFGVGVDRAVLKDASARLGAHMAELEAHAFAEAKHPFNMGSPKQLQEVLFNELGLPPGKKTKTGYSTDSDVLQDLVQHPLPAIILEWRELTKLKSTYADQLQNMADAEGRVHTSLNQTVAATGRLSSSDPNLQNIPTRTEIGRQIRAAFIPAPGTRLLSADYSQIELRIMAHICRDPELIRAFAEGRDIHTTTAARVFNVPVDKVTSDQRRSAKTVNFAVLYGQKEFGLSRQLRIGMLEARQLIDAYFEEFPGVLQYIETTLAGARKNGYVETLPPYCRKRYMPGIHAGNRNERQAAEREAMNAPVQGTASDVIKAAMVNVDRAMKEAGVKSRMILQVHDELLFEVVPEEEQLMLELVRREMEGAYELSVPLTVETKLGSNWRDVAPTGAA